MSEGSPLGGAVVAMGFLAVSLAGATTGFAQQRLTPNVTENPSEAVFVYSDMAHFLDAIEAIASGADSARALETQYFDRASPGLGMFMEKYDLGVERLQESPYQAFGRVREQVERVRGDLLELLPVVESRAAPQRNVERREGTPRPAPNSYTGLDLTA